MPRLRSATDQLRGAKGSTNYEVRSTVTARILACGRGAIIKNIRRALLSFWRAVGCEACFEGRSPLDFARGPSSSHRMSASTSLGGRTRRPSVGRPSAERSRGHAFCKIDDARAEPRARCSCELHTTKYGKGTAFR